MLPDLLDTLADDPWRRDNPFSAPMTACQDVLFRAGASRAEMADALNKWLATEQPCQFGRMEAKQPGRLAYCLLTENDLYQGDRHVRARIEQDRAAWKDQARNGGSHGFIIVAISRDIAHAVVDDNLLRLSQHLCNLYLDSDVLDQILHDSLILEIAGDGVLERREWKVGANFFSAQGDGRWWRDHRFPGGIAYSMNSVGHMARHKAEDMLRRNPTLAERVADVPRERLVYWAVPTAMRTIGIPQTDSTRGTWLAERGQFPEDREQPPYDVRERVFRELAGHSENRYFGAYHTDQTIPSSYFDVGITTLAAAGRRDDLVFTYLHSPADEDYLSMGIGNLAQAIEEDERARPNHRRDET